MKDREFSFEVGRTYYLQDGCMLITLCDYEKQEGRFKWFANQADMEKWLRDINKVQK